MPKKYKQNDFETAYCTYRFDWNHIISKKVTRIIKDEKKFTQDNEIEILPKSYNKLCSK